MLNCRSCGQMVKEGSNFCWNCGAKLDDVPNTKETPIKDVFTHVVHGINRVAGVDNPTELKFRDIFSKVFAKHTEEEAENIFIVGTNQTTPPLQNIMDTWPKPWLFARVFMLVAIAYFGLYIGLTTFNDVLFLPGLIIMGSVMVPLTMLIFFWEMNVPQNISLYTITKMVLIGGVLSLVASLFFYQLLGNSQDSIVIGIVEETAKLIVVLAFLRRRKYRFVLNGLLIGAAVGAGFATFETAGYVLNIALGSDLQSMYSTLFWRGVLAPGGHIVWAALSGAALCMVKGDQEFQWSMLKNLRFLRIFVIVILLHAGWDTFLPSDNGIPIFQIILTVISWVIAFAIVGSGLKEITNEKKRSNESMQERNM